MTDHQILKVENLSKSYGGIKAVDGVSFFIRKGETLGLVGESGCGKSTVALGVMQDLGVNGRIVNGSIKFKGRNLNEMSTEELRRIRGREIAMIYQEPMASLNPNGWPAGASKDTTMSPRRQSIQRPTYGVITAM